MPAGQGPVQFSIRGLLLATTAACVLLASMQWMLPPDVPAWMRAWSSIVLLAMVGYAFWISSRSRSRPWQEPIDYVTVKVDSKWRRRIKSPWIMGPVAALTGVSVSFAPFYLFWIGPPQDLGAWEWFGVAACFLMIYLVPGFYMRLAVEVMAELMRSDAAAGSEQVHQPASPLAESSTTVAN